MQVHQVRQAAFRQLLLIYYQRLYLGLRFDASPADSFSSCKTPVETLTNPDDDILYIICIYRKTGMPRLPFRIL